LGRRCGRLTTETHSAHPAACLHVSLECVVHMLALSVIVGGRVMARPVSVQQCALGPCNLPWVTLCLW